MRITMAREQPDYFPLFLMGLISGVIGTVCVLIGIRVKPEQLKSIFMSYTDFVIVMLTAVTVVITILAIFIAILALWGYSQFQKLTETASKNHLEKLLQEGPFAKRIEEAIVQHVSGQLQRGELRSLLAERVDSIILNDASLRAERDQNTPPEKPFND